MMNEGKPICQSCGCSCLSCSNNNSLHLHEEIETLKNQVKEGQAHVAQMEAAVAEHAQQFPHGELHALRDTLASWQDKYNRLYETYKKTQKVNQNLEDKLLKIVDKFESEKTALIREVTGLNKHLAEAQQNITSLEEQKELLKTDLQTAIQLLQCNPSNFLHPRYTMLPSDLQEKVRHHFNSCSPAKVAPQVSTEEVRIPMVTFPPTALVYAEGTGPPLHSNDNMTNGDTPDVVPASLVAGVLASRTIATYNDVATQTSLFVSSDWPPIHSSSSSQQHLNGFVHHVATS